MEIFFHITTSSNTNEAEASIRMEIRANKQSIMQHGNYNHVVPFCRFKPLESGVFCDNAISPYLF